MPEQPRPDRPVRLLLAALGSRGDVEPFIQLARAAQHAGHVVRIALPDQSDLGTDGLDAVSLGVSFADLAQNPDMSSVRAFRERIRPAMSRALAVFVATGMEWEPDIIVAHPKVLTAAVVADRLGIPRLGVELTPTVTSTAEFPAAGIASRSLGPVLNRLTYRAVGMAGAMFAADVRAACRRLGISYRRLTEPVASLVAVSPSLLPRPSDWPPTTHVTGDWHRPDHQVRATAEVRAFVEAEAPFLYTGFGSMTGGDAAERAEAIVEGARRAGLRVLLATGWGGLQPPTRCAGPDVFVTDSAPHDAVLSHAVAAIHHAGAGTTHAVARAGIPSVTVPFLGDQPFWAAQLARRGLAPAPLRPERLTADRVHTAIESAVDCTSQARAVAQQMSAEDGIERAVALIEGHA